MKCPNCGAIGFFHDFAKYPRFLLNNNDERMKIQRVQCNKCKVTHALLPDIIIPYRYFSAPFLLKLFTLFLIDKNSISLISKKLDISISTIEKLIKYYKNDHEQHMPIINPELMNPLDHYFLIDYFHMFFYSFMQHLRTHSKIIYHLLAFS